MLIRLSNKREKLDHGVDEMVNFDQRAVYDKERQSSGNIRLKFNVSAIADGSLFNPITETITEYGYHVNGINNLDITKLNNKNSMFGIDMMNSLPIRCIEQPYMTNASPDNQNNFVLPNSSRRYKRSLPVKYSGATDGDFSRVQMNSTRSYGPVETNNESIFSMNMFLTYDQAVRLKMSNNGGEFGFTNPLFFKKTFDNTLNKKGMVDENVGDFIPLYPTKDLYSFGETYNDYNQTLESNWLTYITYPYSNLYDDKYLRELHGNERNTAQGIKHALIVWCVDEISDTVTYFKTKTKNGFLVGDVINIYRGDEMISSSIEVVSKPDDYTVGVSMNGNKLFNWTLTNQVDLTDKEYTTSYEYKGGRMYCYYNTGKNSAGVDVIMEANARYDLDDTDNIISLVRVENFVECDYYIKTVKAIDVNPINRRNSFSKNIYGINNGCLMVDEDINVNDYKDNLGRPITDLYLTVVKENKGYKTWYTEPDTASNPMIRRKEITSSHCFGNVNGGFELDPYFVDNDSVTYLTADDGIMVHAEGVHCETDDKVFRCELCEYSSSTAKETTIQPFMHRFNTAQRDCISPNISMSMNSIVYSGSSTPNKQRYKPLVAKVNRNTLTLGDVRDSLSVGYKYKPHNRIRVKTYLNELRSEYAEYYDVISSSSGKTYGNSVVYNMTLKGKNKTQLNTDVMIYVRSSSGRTFDLKFYGKVDNWDRNTLVTIKLDDSSDKVMLDRSVNNVFNLKNGDMMYVVEIDKSAPAYAELLNDDGFYYRWHEIVQNGYDDGTSVPVYPFTNNALYIENTYCVYLRRQRDVIYDDVETVWPTASGGGFYYVPQSEKVNIVSYLENNEVKEIVECE